MPCYKQQLLTVHGVTEWIPLGGASKQIAVGNDSNGSLVFLQIGKNNDMLYYSRGLVQYTHSCVAASFFPILLG